MTSLKRSCVLLCALGAVGLVGCGPKMDKDAMQSMKPERPAQLTMLDRFVGEWKGTGEMTMAGSDEVMHSTGTSKMSWGLDKMVLIENSEYKMGDDTMMGMGTWTWDKKHNRFHTTWVDSWGSYGSGYAKYNDDKDCWTMRGTSTGCMGTTTGKGTMKFLDNNTMEWTWSEYCCLGLMKVMEMKGTSTRQ